MSVEGSSEAMLIELDHPAEGTLESGAEEVTLTTTTELNLNGHCFICLKLLEEEDSGSWRDSGGKGVKSFQPLWCYLTGCSHDGKEEDGGEEEFQLPSMQDLPPVCGQCYKGLLELYRLHEQLLEVQRRIQRQTVRVRNCISGTRDKGEESEAGGEKTRREKFLRSLETSAIPLQQVEQSSELVVKIHDRIIGRGNTPVLFPPLCVSEQTEEVEVDPTHQQGDPITLLDVEIDEADGSLPPKKQKVQVEFITIEEYSDVGNQVFVTPMEEEVEVEQGMEISIGAAEELNQVDQSIEISKQVEREKYAEPAIPTEHTVTVVHETSEVGGDSGVSIGGVAVDPSANYVMITTNVTDPNTGIASMQPILLSVSQLQAMQQQQGPSQLDLSTATPQLLQAIPAGQPSTSGSEKKSSKKRPNTNYTTSSEYVTPTFQEDLQPCDVCNARIPRGSEVASHLATHVGSDYVFYCADCQLGFISPFRLQKYHRNRPVRCRLDTSPLTGPVFLCDQCPFQTEKMQLLKKHLEQHDAEEGRAKSFQCPLCPLRFTGKRSVEVHLGDKHVFTKPSGRQKCDVCGSIFDLGEIEAHLWSHGITEIIRCKLCMYMFSSVDAMMEHQRMVKRRGIHDISCHVCSSRFIRAKDLRLHYFEAHGLGSKYLCGNCNEDFFTLQSFETHQKKCSGQEERESQDQESSGEEQSSPSKKPSKPVYPSMAKKECPTCGKCMSSADILLRHRIKEHGHPPLKCSRSDCQVTFTSEADRRAHVATDHQGYTVILKHYTCDQCGEGFAKKDKLKTHKFVKHSDSKPFTCDVCGLTYRNKMTLQSHVNLKHLGVEKKKDKMCDICGRGFTDSQVLKHHKLIHTNERPFPCSMCGQRFRQRTALRTHEKSHVQLGDAFKPKGEMERRKKKKDD